MIGPLLPVAAAPAPDSPVLSNGRAFLADVARSRRTHLLCLLLARGHAMTFAQIRWVAVRDPTLSARKLKTDLLALLDLGLVAQRSGLDHRADYAPTLAARRMLKP